MPMTRLRFDATYKAMEIMETAIVDSEEGKPILKLLMMALRCWASLLPMEWGHAHSGEAPLPPPEAPEAYSKSGEESNGIVAMMSIQNQNSK